MMYLKECKENVYLVSYLCILKILEVQKNSSYT